MSNDKRTDKQIEMEAKLAINEVIKARKGQAARAIRPEMRRAFPFGPKASEREKRIWDKLVDQATAELEKWPGTLPLALLLVFFAQAAEALPRVPIGSVKTIPPVVSPRPEPTSPQSLPWVETDPRKV
ncbi:MAG: hypothetical protein K2Y32_00440 [Candidatus Obscuribacterales bacterium]|nr:hypothetical protein [Candidatus Obscuribacterales bacterium]